MKDIVDKINLLKSMKLPLLNRRSKAFMDWKNELERLNKLLEDERRRTSSSSRGANL